MRQPLAAILGVVDADDAKRFVACDEDAERNARNVVPVVIGDDARGNADARHAWRASEAWGV
jgi:hypothetical protein